ncbi:MAG: hypothetical protein IT233_07775 [Bacteroidia bacterium]|nr:hypothetical protein [Bacteroidia bacterium]
MLDEKRLIAIWRSKKIEAPYEEFKKWYDSIEKKCCYCGITEDEIKFLLDKQLLFTKRIDTRGRRLEFDRKQSELPYNDLSNIVLSCYWCNNAKTDTFSHDEFLEVGKSFSAIWKKRLENQ